MPASLTPFNFMRIALVLAIALCLVSSQAEAQGGTCHVELPILSCSATQTVTARMPQLNSIKLAAEPLPSLGAEQVVVAAVDPVGLIMVQSNQAYSLVLQTEPTANIITDIFGRGALIKAPPIADLLAFAPPAGSLTVYYSLSSL